jgi:competence protein ComEA
LTIWCAYGALSQSLGAAPDAPFAAPVRVDLNRADLPTLMSLPGIGRGRASAIILRRVRLGRFESLAELGRVDGLGPKTVAALRPFLVDPGGDPVGDPGGDPVGDPVGDPGK